MAVYALSGKWRTDGGSWTSSLVDGTKYPLGSSGSHEYDTFFNRPAAFLTDYAGGANYIVSANLLMTRVDEYTQTETIRLAAGSSAAGKVGSYVYHNFPANTTRQVIPFTDAAKLLVSNAYIIANASGYGSYVEVKASTVDLEVIWAPVNTAPYWSAGATIDVTGSINGGYIQEGSVVTASWPICNDDDGNLASYEYGISVDGGATYTYTTTTDRAVAFSSSTQGQSVIFAVRGVDDLGLTSAWIYSSTYTINYAPNTPVISSINELTAANNIVIPYNANMVVTAPAHSGGFASGYSALNYRQTGAYTGAYGTGTTIALANLSNLVGQTASISAQVTDGWTTKTSTAFNVKVGKTYAIPAPALTSNIGWIDSQTALKVASAQIDGVYFSSAIETVTLYYNYNGSTTWNTLYTTTRTYSSRTTPSPITISNIMYLLNSKDSTFGKTSKMVYFRVGVSTGHLSAENVSQVDLAIPYTAPAITDYAISQADGSSTFKYSMQSSIPAAESTFTVALTTTKNTNSSDTITATIFTKVSGTTSWVSRSVIGLGSTSPADCSVTFSFVGLGLVSGQTIYVKIELSSMVNSVNIIHASVEPTWTGTSIKEIIFRSLPSFSVAAYGTQQLSFIRNGSPAPNNAISTPIELTLDPTKAYYIKASARINSSSWTEAGDPVMIYNTGTSKHQFATAGILLSSTMDTSSGKTWPTTSFQVLKPSPTPIVSPNILKVPDNTTQTVAYTFQIWEAYRSSTSDTTPQAWSSSFAQRGYFTVTLTFTSDTICKPVFGTGSISFVRV